MRVQFAGDDGGRFPVCERHPEKFALVLRLRLQEPCHAGHQDYRVCHALSPRPRSRRPVGKASAGRQSPCSCGALPQLPGGLADWSNSRPTGTRRQFSECSNARNGDLSAAHLQGRVCRNAHGARKARPIAAPLDSPSEKLIRGAGKPLALAFSSAGRRRSCACPFPTETPPGFGPTHSFWPESSMTSPFGKIRPAFGHPAPI